MKLIVHGGLLEIDDPLTIKQMRSSLHDIAKKAYDFLTTHTAVETVVFAVEMLENDPLFHAGTGSKLQADGVIRMSAAISDGAALTTSAVVNIQDVQNPVRVAEKLMNFEDKALSGDEALQFARKHGFGYYNVETEKRRKEYEEQKKAASRKGTVGCVAIDAQGNLAASTSTGGGGAEMPGRVSDSPTVAGNYANKFCAVSCTGTGEDIVNNALAAKIVVRVTDGNTIVKAFRMSLDEVREVDGDAGAIGIDRNGKICQSFTKAKVTYASYDGKTVKTFLDDQADIICVQ